MELHSFQFPAMASQNEIQLYAASASESQRIADLAIAEVQRIERHFSRYREDSLLTRINRSAGKAAITVDAETATLLNYGEACFQKSVGLFDLTSGVLRRVWDFRRPVLPDPRHLASVLELVGWDKVEWDPPKVYLPLAGMELDFGGIGKEYATDRATVICQTEGATSGLVNLAGDVRVIGPHPDGSPWQIGIQHPRQGKSLLARIAVSEGALTTSGDYERYFELDGKRYCHILNPRTGYPVSALQSVSIVAPLCIVAGSLSTIAMLKEEAGEAFLRGEKIPYLLVDAAGKISGSSVKVVAHT